MAVRRGKDRRCLYDLDDLGQTIAIQRTYSDSLNPLIQTPITPLFLAREALVNLILEQIGLEDLPMIGRVANLRKATVCFPNPSNTTGRSEFRCVLPWHPATVGLVLHLREINLWPGIGSISYEGESYRVEDSEPPQTLPTPPDLPSLPPSYPGPLPPGAPDPPALPPGDP